MIADTGPPGDFDPTPDPGVYYDVPAEQYHRWDAMSNSWLKHIADASLKHFKYAREHPPGQTDAMLRGTVLHALCLEPLDFAARFALEPEVDKRTKLGRERLAQFADEVGGRTVISQSLYDSCRPMARALMAHPIARELLADGTPEVSVVWDDADTGIRCKARYDYLLPPMLGDVKSTKSAEPFQFSRACNTYGYHRQGAFYLDGARAVGLDVDMFAFAAVEVAPPHDVIVYAADKPMLLAGRAQYKRALFMYKYALETHQWPGRNEHDVEPISIPAYVLRDEGIEVEQ